MHVDLQVFATTFASYAFFARPIVGAITILAVVRLFGRESMEMGGSEGFASVDSLCAAIIIFVVFRVVGS